MKIQDLLATGTPLTLPIPASQDSSQDSAQGILMAQGSVLHSAMTNTPQLQPGHVASQPARAGVPGATAYRETLPKKTCDASCLVFTTAWSVLKQHKALQVQFCLHLCCHRLLHIC